MHEMWRTIAIDDPGHLSVCLSVSQLVANIGDHKNFVLHGSPYFLHRFDAAFAKSLLPVVTCTCVWLQGAINLASSVI